MTHRTAGDDYRRTRVEAWLPLVRQVRLDISRVASVCWSSPAGDDVEREGPRVDSGASNRPCVAASSFAAALGW